MTGRHDARYYLPKFTRLEERVAARATGKLRDYSRRSAGGATPKAEEKEKYYSDDPETGIPFIRVQNLSVSGELSLDDVKLIDLETHHGMLARSHVGPDDLLTKITGVGRMAVSSVPPAGFQGNINQHLVRIKTKDRHTSEVLAAYLNTDIAEQLATRRATGGTRPALDYPALRSIPIIFDERILPIAASARERRNQRLGEAAALLASIDDYLLSELGITLPPATENTLANRTFRVSAHELGGSRFDPTFFSKEFINLTHALEERAHKRLGEVCTLSNENWDQVSLFTDTFPYLEISEIDIGTGAIGTVAETLISEAPSRARMIVRQHDILVSTTRPSRGAITLADESLEYPIIASTGFAVIRRVVSELIDRAYLFHVLRSKIGLRQMEQRSSGGNYPAITSTELRRLIIPIPSLDLQHQIVAGCKQRISDALALRQRANDELESAKREIEAILLGEAA
ncbi:restriction endonuclease subunit S [Sphingomonas sp. HHU CXW]|uniref:Restriction endonuclease subunit S n=1 Tax=Sphingomonas hominis TaxID=2741495 RepID=A0ABX2JSY3_9SPHN|nr:restriction endonuclease subunit S [Sphingomonas hominis]NTS66162.1 restriction endonuclease subunit S [Sphingomonas hominis]